MNSRSDDLTYAETLAANIRSSLIKRVEPTTPSKLPFKADSLRNILLYRVSELADDSCKLFRLERHVSASILTRSIIETAALLFLLNKKIKYTIDYDNITDIDAFLIKALLGSRNKLDDLMPVAINVLTTIDHTDAHYEGFKDAFEYLCEFSHPNWAGSLGSYGNIDLNVPGLDLVSAKEKFDGKSGIRALIISLQIVIDTYDGIADLLPEFVAICNKNCA